MIRFHYHRAMVDVPHLGIEKGDRLCHVYSDASLEELVAWGREHGLRPEWIHDGSLPHYDAFGERLEWCGPGVSRTELVEHMRMWREAEAESGAPDPEATCPLEGEEPGSAQ